MAAPSDQTQIRRQRWVIALLLLCVALMAGAFFGRATDPTPPPNASSGTAPSTLAAAPTADPAAEPAPRDPNAPIIEWVFDNVREGVVPDSSGHGYNARITGQAQLSPGWNGHKALTLDGTGSNNVWQGQDQNCGLSIEKRLDQAFQHFSIEAWIRKDPGPWMPVVYRGSWDNPSGFGLYTEWSAGKVAFGHYGENGVQSEHIVQDGKWHHVVGTIDSSGNNDYVYRIYIDGNLDAEQKGTYAVTDASADSGTLMVGCPNSSGADNPYKGDIGRIAIFDVALTPEIIKKRFESQRPPAATPPPGELRP